MSSQPINQSHKDEPIIDPIDFANNQVKIQRQDLEQQQRLNDSLSNDSAYVDPLDFMERKTAQNQEVQEAIADAHDKLMAKTGGQAVEEDLGGWLLVFTLVLIFCVIFLAFDLGMSIVSLKSDPYIFINVLANGLFIFFIGLLLYDIFTRRNPLKWLAFFCFLLALSAIFDLWHGYGFFITTAISNYLATGRAGLQSLLQILSTAITVCSKAGLAIGLYMYFSNSKSVRRTLVGRDILDPIKEGKPKHF